MKLLVCDDKEIRYFSIPDKIDGMFTINFDCYVNNVSYNEILNIKAVNNNWVINSENKVQLVVNGIVEKTIVLQDNINFDIRYTDMPRSMKIFIIPNFEQSYKFSLKEVNNLNIGSGSNNNIVIPGVKDNSITISKIEKDYYITRVDELVSSSYLNSFVYLKEKLNIGDVIFVNGARIIYMKDFILVIPFDNQIQILGLNKCDENETFFTDITPVSDLEKHVKLFNENQLFVHTPRLKYEVEEVELEIDSPPTKVENEKVPLILTVGSSALLTMTSSVSLIFGIRNFLTGQGDAFSLILESAMFGLMLIAGILLPYIMEKWERHNNKKKEKERQKKYRNYIKEQEEYIEQIIAKQTNIINNNNLSLDKIASNILNNCKDIWSREIFDNDFLTINIGYGKLPAKIKMSVHKKRFSLINDDLEDLVRDITSKKYSLDNVPISFSLINDPVVPIVIEGQHKYDYIKSIMLQLLYFYMGSDLKIITITNPLNEKNWEFMKYVPHSWDEKYEYRFFASTDEEISQLSLYLEQEYDTRSNNNEKENNIHYLIVTDDYTMARDLSIIDKITEKNLGFSLLVFESSIKNIPSNFNTLIQIYEDHGVVINKNATNEEQITFTPTYISNIDINLYARIIANIPVNINKSEYEIPSSLSFLDMFYAGRVDQLNILARWKNSNPTISLKTPIGMKENNKIVELDLHEKYHGPHGLIAGSTGSGKSEFIMTYILSLAVNYHPYEVQFVLIDYKGGGLAGAFENRETEVKIPHLVGTITNLDKSEMNRTLISIKSELQRRQRVFNLAKEKNDESTIDIYKYQRLYREGKVDEPMSHLFIISDEFAELKASQPDFMDELVSAARIGRSLGIHLILATQKPSGVVDEQIWSNTRFRVCLKVQTTEDSTELLKRPDAAYLTEAGRFYLQVGNDELFELGQSGYSGAKYIPTDIVEKKLEDDLLILSNNGSVLKVLNEEVKKDETVNYGDQITNIVKYLYNLAVSENIKFSSLWKENIPNEIYYENIIKKYNMQPKPFYISPIIGEYDDPENQEQGAVFLPLSTCGNTFILGNSGSGKSTLLSTIIFSTIVNHNCDEVNIYVIDFGLEKLKDYEGAPQVGEILTANDTDKIKFLFYMINEEKNRRFAYYSTHGGSFENDINNGNCPFPTILIIINQFESFKESFEDLVDYDFGPLTRNCTKAGIIFIISSSLSNSLSYSYENNFSKKIVLNLTDLTDYSIYFNTSIIPKKNPGRGIIAINDHPYEFQVSLLFKDALEKNLKYIINELCLVIKKRARKVPVIPEEVTFELLENKISNLNNVPLGINIETAQVSYYDFTNLLNVISASNNQTAKMFFPSLTHIISKIPNTKIIIINSIKSLNFSYLQEVKYYDSDFKGVIKTIDSNVIKYQTNPSNNNFLIIFLGYASLQNYLMKEKDNDSEVVTVDDLIVDSKNTNNFKYIIYDSEQGISKIEDGLIDNYFNRSNGLWLGKDFDTQSVFDASIKYDSKSYGNGTVTSIKNHKTNHIKFM